MQQFLTNAVSCVTLGYSKTTVGSAVEFSGKIVDFNLSMPNFYLYIILMKTNEKTPLQRLTKSRLPILAIEISLLLYKSVLAISF